MHVWVRAWVRQGKQAGVYTLHSPQPQSSLADCISHVNNIVLFMPVSSVKIYKITNLLNWRIYPLHRIHTLSLTLSLFLCLFHFQISRTNQIRRQNDWVCVNRHVLNTLIEYIHYYILNILLIVWGVSNKSEHPIKKISSIGWREREREMEDEKRCFKRNLKKILCNAEIFISFSCFKKVRMSFWWCVKYTSWK